MFSHNFSYFNISPPQPITGIKAVDGTAKAGEDFNGKKAKQVQFNPGQTEGVWRVRILDDTVFELAETFEVILHDAVMGSLEFPENALVRILDGEDGEFVMSPIMLCFVGSFSFTHNALLL